MTRNFLFLIVAIFTLFTAYSKEISSTRIKLACTVDVTINEGSAISFCQGEFVTINASSGFVSYAWSGPQTGSSPSLAPTISGEYVITAVDGIGCISTDTIDVTIFINPVGVIVSSEGNLLCPGSPGTTLSLTQAFSAYLWSNNSTNPSIQVSQGGTYAVQVTDLNGCTGNSAITINQPNFTLNAIGNASVCNGSSVTLVASGGTSYVWSTTELNPSITVSPITNTNYSVLITNGTCSQTLNLLVTAVTMASTAIQDTFYVESGAEIELNGPDNYTSYNWSPSTNLNGINSQGVIFAGDQSAQYIVNSSNSNGCVRSDTIWVIVVKVTVPTGFSPNSDGYNDAFVIPELAQFQANLIVFNRWGDKVYEKADYQNDWDGTCQNALCLGQGQLPEGTYFYSLDVDSIHFDGYTTIKR